MLYAADVPADQISWALAFCAAANYLAFDGTKQGLGLALVCALICPASEVSSMQQHGLGTPPFALCRPQPESKRP
jgi:hypothetical protein